MSKLQSPFCKGENTLEFVPLERGTAAERQGVAHTPSLFVQCRSDPISRASQKTYFNANCMIRGSLDVRIWPNVLLLKAVPGSSALKLFVRL